MTIETLHNIGEFIPDKNGRTREILGVHIWMSGNKQTERYYFGNCDWRTIKRASSFSGGNINDR